MDACAQERVVKPRRPIAAEGSMKQAEATLPRKKSEMQRFSDSLLAALAAYEAMAKEEKGKVDRAIVQTLDMPSKDWAPAMFGLAESCQTKS